MKYIIIAVSFLIYFYPASGQTANRGTFFQAKNKKQLYYVDLHGSSATVFEMGHYFDKGGTGFSILSTDTLVRQSNESYQGTKIKILKQDGNLYLVTSQKKSKSIPLDTVQNLASVYKSLNNAYYLDKYFKMSDELNKVYPLNHHSFRNGFYTWDSLAQKDIDYLRFREFADERIKHIQDSISIQQEAYVARTNHLLKVLASADYTTLKDSLSSLPANYKSASWYYGTVVSEIAKKRPEFFFRLAEDFPDNKNLIFSTVEDDKAVIEGLKNVEGYDAIKKEFLKYRRFEKTLPFRIIGTYAVIGGLITWLIVSQ